jgi:hypothetical protein
MAHTIMLFVIFIVFLVGQFVTFFCSLDNFLEGHHQLMWNLFFDVHP